MVHCERGRREEIPPMGAPTTRVAVWLLLPFPGGGRGCKLGQPLQPGSVWKPKDGMLAKC